MSSRSVLKHILAKLNFISIKFCRTVGAEKSGGKFSKKKEEIPKGRCTAHIQPVEFELYIIWALSDGRAEGGGRIH